jgi:hypothetical protein
MIFRLFMELPQIEFPGVTYSQRAGKDTRAFRSISPANATVSYARNRVQVLTNEKHLE